MTLKVLFTILLSVLVFILVFAIIIITLVLFPAIRYEIKGNYDEKPKIFASLDFIFKIVRLRYNYDEDEKFKIYIFWFELGRKNKIKKTAEEVTEEVTEEVVEEVAEEVTKEVKEVTPDKAEIDKTAKVKRTIKKKKEVKEKRSKKINIIEKINLILNYPDRDNIIKYTIQLIAELILAVKPKKFVIKGTIGFDDPSITGFTIGALSVIKGVTGYNIEIEGNFIEKCLNINGELKGKTSFFALLLPIVRYSLKKPIWKIIKQFIFKPKNDKANRKEE